MTPGDAHPPGPARAMRLALECVAIVAVSIGAGLASDHLGGSSAAGVFTAIVAGGIMGVVFRMIRRKMACRG